MKITIARQCGSGGHEIAEALAEKLHLEIFEWGDGNEYDLCINTGIIGIEYAVEMILEYIRFENIL